MPARGSSTCAPITACLDVFEKTYATKHRAPREAVFGLTELHPEVARAKLVGNPGCYPTGATLAVAPLAKAGLVERVVYDSKSGISGAGVEPTETTHYPNMVAKCHSLQAHNAPARSGDQAGTVPLSPGDKSQLHSSRHPVSAGHPHHSPCIGRRVREETLQDKNQVASIYREFYKNAPFVRMADSIPRLSSVRGSNFCDISFEAEKGSDRLVVISAIDNLVKGASGQAIQNMNLMAGFDERTGPMVPGHGTLN